MNTKEFYYLTTINNFGNLSHASKVLGISQPALSKFLAKCEQIFGYPLFVRYQRQLIPTEIGRYVVLCAHKILDEKNRMLLTMQKVTGNTKNKIKLSTAPNRGAIIYSKIYNEFSRRFPDTSLELTELFASEQSNAICSGFIDIALGSGEKSVSVQDVPIAHEELLVSIPISHPLAHSNIIQLTDLKDTPFVLQGKKHSIRILADKLFSEAGFEPVIAFESDDVLLIDSMLHQAVGVGLVSQSHVTPCDEIAYLHLDPPIYQQLHIRYPLNHVLSESEKFLVSLLVKERLGDPRYEIIHSEETDALLTILSQSAEFEIGDNKTNEVESYTNSLSIKDVNFDTKILEYLIAIIEEKSLTSAANKFFLAQPALSRHLKNIEESIGLNLFKREHNQLQPTNAGKVFVNHSRNILHIENEMFSYISSTQNGHIGRFYIYCDQLIYERLRTEIENNFADAYPDIELIVQEATRETTIEHLLNASIDIGLFFTLDSIDEVLNAKIVKTTELVYIPDQSETKNTMNSNSNFNKCNSRKLMVAPKNTTLRNDQESLFLMQFSEAPEIICEANTQILDKLIGISNAGTILPLHLINEKHQNSYISFDPPQYYHLVMATHIQSKLPKFSKGIIVLLKKLCSDLFI